MFGVCEHPAGRHPTEARAHFQLTQSDVGDVAVMCIYIYMYMYTAEDAAPPIRPHCCTRAAQVRHKCGTSAAQVRHKCGTSAAQVRHKCGTSAAQVRHKYGASAEQVRSKCGDQCGDRPVVPVGWPATTRRRQATWQAGPPAQLTRACCDKKTIIRRAGIPGFAHSPRRKQLFFRANARGKKENAHHTHTPPRRGLLLGE